MDEPAFTDDNAGDGDARIAVELRIGSASLRDDIRLMLLEEPAVVLVQNASAVDVVVTDDAAIKSTRSVLLNVDGVAPHGWRGSVLPSSAVPAAVRIAIEAAHHGLVCRADQPDLEDGAAGLVATDESDDADVPDPTAPILSARESEVLQLMATGASNKAIARALGISAHTAKFHVTAIMTKLDATSRTDAVARAMRSGLVMM